MNKKEASSNATAVDTFKLFFSICIMALHTSLLKITSPFSEWMITSTVLRMGVPYFFICSGYFYWKKIINGPKTKEWVSKCARGYVLRNINTFVFFSSAGLIVHTALEFHRNGLEGAVITIHNAIFYPLGAMWFVSACMIAVVIITILRSHKVLVTVLGISGYIFALICNSYFFIVEGTAIGRFVDLYLQYFVSARKGFFIGILFIGMGALIADGEYWLIKIKNKTLCLLFIMLFLFQLLESKFLFERTIRDDGSLFLAMPLLAAIVFVISLRVKMPFSMSRSIYLRRMSVYFYCLHPLLNATIGTVIIIATGNVILNFIVIFGGCVILWLLTQKSNNKYIRAILP